MNLPPILSKNVAGLPLGAWILGAAGGIGVGIYLRSKGDPPVAAEAAKGKADRLARGKKLPRMGGMGGDNPADRDAVLNQLDRLWTPRGEAHGWDEGAAFSTGYYPAAGIPSYRYPYQAAPGR